MLLKRRINMLVFGLWLGTLLQVVIGGIQYPVKIGDAHWETAHTDAALAKEKCLAPNSWWDVLETNGDVNTAWCRYQDKQFLLIKYSIIAGVVILITGHLVSMAKLNKSHRAAIRKSGNDV